MNQCERAPVFRSVLNVFYYVPALIYIYSNGYLVMNFLLLCSFLKRTESQSCAPPRKVSDDHSWSQDFPSSSSSPAKFLSQIEGESGPVPVEILAQAKGKDAPNDTLPKFAARYLLKHRAGALTKESHSGKLVSDWEKFVSDSDTKPAVVDMSPAVSAFMAVKDVEELVSKPRFQLVIHLLTNAHRKLCKNQPL
jgi:hypothetical protein